MEWNKEEDKGSEKNKGKAVNRKTEERKGLGGKKEQVGRERKG
jgi:hypothetical protein